MRLLLLIGLVLATTAAPEALAPPESLAIVPGHLLAALTAAVPITPSPAQLDAAITLTVTLNRDDPEGFERYLKDLYDPASSTYRHFLDPVVVAEKFGPSRQRYAALEHYFASSGLDVISTSSNRLTLTLRGSRQDVQRSLHVHLGDYRLDGTDFFANESEPTLPRSLAASVQNIGGLNDLAKPRAHRELIKYVFLKLLYDICIGVSVPITLPGPAGTTGSGNIVNELNRASIAGGGGAAAAATKDCGTEPVKPSGLSANLTTRSTVRPLAATRSNAAAGSAAAAADPVSWTNLDGTGQTVGLLEFDNFVMSDVADYLTLTAQPASLIGNLSEVPANGGATPGANQDEVLLDINAVLWIAPGAKVVVYDAPFSGAGTSFQGLFNAMVAGGVSIISNSWDYCEDQTTLADVQSIDSILQAAAASGITVFNGSGDTGSTCRDGSVNTIAVPADSPNATAVGGSSLSYGPGYTYGSETWWDDSTTSPPAGQGGFGVSQYFSRPGYQAALNAGTMRSIPDVVINADPETGVLLCQASAGGCPTGNLYGGTSLAAPTWAGLAAQLNQALGSNVGSFNALIYPFAATPAFHGAASLGSDFAHVGLGSPNLNQLYLHLSNTTVGSVSAATSTVFPWASLAAPLPPLPSSIAADGTSAVSLVVTLRDANGNAVSGKNVTVSAAGGSAQISPASVTTSVSNGAAIFSVTDLNAEAVTFSAVDTTDGVSLAATASVSFSVPPAASAGIAANPSTLPADGQTPATITVTLKDSLGRPASGKTITLSNGGAHAVATGPTPGVTNASGQIQFSATDQVNEAVTFTAVDVSDGNLPVPGSATVTYSGSTSTACGIGVTATAGTGYRITPFVTGLPAAPTVFYENVNVGCPGAENPVFTSGGTTLVADFLTGGLFQTGQAGGAVSSTNVIATLGTSLANLTYGKDGSLYATTGTSSAQLVQLDASSGAVLRTVASGLVCPTGLSVDPLSGDLFFDDDCTGAGLDNASIFRVIDPANGNPSQVVVYATLPTTPNGAMAFAPNGTLYAVSGYYGNINAPVEQISGTNASTVTVTAVPGVSSDFAVAIGATNANGSAQSLIVEPAGTLTAVPIANPSAATILATGSPGVGVTGPDGCLYSAHYDTVYRLAASNGSCNFAPTSPAPSMNLTPASVSPNPVQGTPLTLTAQLHNVSPLSGVPVGFVVSGANAQVGVVDTDANGHAAFTYTAASTGTDTVTAASTVSTTALATNAVRVTWIAGKHVTYMTLNGSPQAGAVNVPVAVSASLTDFSATSVAPLGGQSITFTLGSASCTAVTSGAGIASCQVTPTQVGTSALTASFTGNSQAVAATVSSAFQVLAAVVKTAAPTVTIGVTPGSITQGSSATLAWSSSNTTSCTASGAWTGPEPTAGTLPIPATAVGSFTYILTCAGAGATSVAAQTTLTVNAAAPPVSVNIAVTPTSITQGSPAKLSWTSSNALSCVATGAWSGSEPTAGTLSITGTSVGGFTYTLTCAGARATSVTGHATLNVTAAVQKTTQITWPMPKAISYGTKLGAAELDATANVPGTFAYNPAAGTLLSAGLHKLVVTFTPTNTQAYSSATATVTLQVNQAKPWVVWLPLPLVYPTPLGGWQLDAFALDTGNFCRPLAGKFVYTPKAGSVLEPGEHELTAVFTPADSNYETTTVHAWVDVLKNRLH